MRPSRFPPSRVPLRHPVAESRAREESDPEASWLRRPRASRAPDRHRLLRQPRGFEGVPTDSERVQRTSRGQMVLDPDEPPMPEPEAVIEVAFDNRPAGTALCQDVPVREDAIIPNRPRLFDHVSVTLVSGKVFGQELDDLLTSVTRPCLREAAHRVVVAVGLPEASPPRREALRGLLRPQYIVEWSARTLQVALDDVNVLLRHRPLSIPRGRVRCQRRRAEGPASGSL